MSDILGIIATAMKDSNYDKEVHDSVSKASPVWARVMAKPAKKAYGNNITWTAGVGQSGKIMSGDPGWVVPMGLTKNQVQASIAIKRILQPVMLSKTIANNNNAAGGDALYDYINGEIMTALNELGQHLGASLYSNGAQLVNAQGGALPQLDGLAAATVRDGTYAGISPANYPGWNGVGVNVMSTTGGTHIGLTFSGSAPTYANLTTASSVFYLPKIIDLACKACTPTNPGPNLITLDAMYHSLLHQLMIDKQQIVKDSWGFDSFTYAGKECVFDPLQPAGSIGIWTIPKLGISQVPGSSVRMGQGDLEKIPGTDFLFGQAGFEGNVQFLERRKFGRIYNLPTVWS